MIATFNSTGGRVWSLTYGDGEILVVTSLQGPGKGHESLPVALIEGQQLVALLVVLDGVAVFCGIIILKGAKLSHEITNLVSF